MWIQNTKGKDAPFSVSLPLTTEEASTNLFKQAVCEGEAAMHGRKKKVLVVDDEPDMLECLQIILGEEGYSVATTEKAEDVEQLQDGCLPDLILLDVLLSGKNGREMVKHLKSQEETRHIPVIMFSAHPSVEKTARQAGAEDFVAKPFEIDELLAKIAYYL
jgi:DNA-binding response OmpR family regulator